MLIVLLRSTEWLVFSQILRLDLQVGILEQNTNKILFCFFIDRGENIPINSLFNFIYLLPS